jgi:hypothetical protein
MCGRCSPPLPALNAHSAHPATSRRVPLHEVVQNGRTTHSQSQVTKDKFPSVTRVLPNDKIFYSEAVLRGIRDTSPAVPVRPPGRRDTDWSPRLP